MLPGQGSRLLSGRPLSQRKPQGTLALRSGMHPPTPPITPTQTQRWIAWQLIMAVEQTHSLGISHGDIKPANVLVTSWHWTYLTDPGPYKPAHIPADDPVRHGAG